MGWAGFGFSAIVLSFVIGCAPIIKHPGPDVQAPQIYGSPETDDASLIMADGMALPLRIWLPDGKQPPDAVVLAVHGFNDYGAFFTEFAQYLNRHNIAAYAYDQRGFGASDDTGYWAGTQAYLDDAISSLALIVKRHPGVPVFGFGESMGGAVLMAAAQNRDALPAALDGLILAAPAVWGRQTMPWYQNATLWLASHLIPSLRFTGQGLDIIASDNMEMLRALGRDPLVIKQTRVDAIWGVVNLMDRALDSAQDFHVRSLILYGERDQVIKQAPIRAMLARLPEQPENGRLIATYEDGYHMLIRDLGAKVVWQDILAWIGNRGITSLPSGAEQRSGKFIRRMGGLAD